MRAYTLSHPGIDTRDGKILVGESGRGRSLVSVPLPPGAVLDEQDRLISCTGPATDCVVLIPDQSGFRGGWHLRDARPEEDWDAIVAAPTRDHGIPEPGLSVQVIAQGHCAQGLAGAAGGGPEYLIVLRHGQAVEIVRGGRLYGNPSCVQLENVAGTITSSDPRADARERAAGGKWESLCTPNGEEPTETVLSWGGGSARQREHSWSLRPHLIDSTGRVHIFDGRDIPDIATILQDVSVSSGYQSGRCDAYRVLLHPGVSLRGYEIPEAESADVPQAEENPAEAGWFSAAIDAAKEK